MSLTRGKRKRKLSLSDFRFRRATLADREAVLSISDNLYWGTDVLPSLYNDYVTDPTRIFYVTLLNDRVVS